MSTRVRIVFDLLLTLLLVFECLHQITGNALHEIVGAAFIVCIVIHLAFAARWIRNAASAFGKGEASKRQKKLAAVAVLLAIDLTILVFSSVVISQLLWDAGANFSALNPGNIWYPIHTAAAYALCILVLGHLSMHWKTVADTLKVPYDPSRREAISSGLNSLVMIGGIALGITGVIRAGFQASDYVEDGNEEAKTVFSGYREVNAQTGEYVGSQSFEVERIGDTGGSEAEALQADDAGVQRCPLCPRQCKLTSPRCGRPYEAGLVSR